MTTNLPRQRDLWVVILVIILGAGATIALRTSANPSNSVAAGVGASVSPSASPGPTEPAADAGPAQAPNLDSLPADTRAQFDALPTGTILVACSPAFATYPEAVIPEVAGGWLMTHPGWRILLHGYCVDNPSAFRSFDPQVLVTP
jgi:hypothetical protein